MDRRKHPAVVGVSMPPPKKTDSERTLGLLETIGTTVADLRGENRAQHEAIDRQLTTLQADLDVVQSAQQAQGIHLASLPCEKHSRRISEAIKAVRNGKVAEETINHVWRRTIQIFAILGAAATIGAALFAALH
jgi:hypothetical protein